MRKILAVIGCEIADECVEEISGPQRCICLRQKGCGGGEILLSNSDDGYAQVLKSRVETRFGSSFPIGGVTTIPPNCFADILKAPNSHSCESCEHRIHQNALYSPYIYLIYTSRNLAYLIANTLQQKTQRSSRSTNLRLSLGQKCHLSAWTASKRNPQTIPASLLTSPRPPLSAHDLAFILSYRPRSARNTPPTSLSFAASSPAYLIVPSSMLTEPLSLVRLETQYYSDLVHQTLTSRLDHIAGPKVSSPLSAIYWAVQSSRIPCESSGI